MTYRVLVTGSRTWDDPATIRRELDALLTEHGSLLVVHGACSRGADAMAVAWVMDRWTFDAANVGHEPHPANWRPGGGSFNRSAGFLRNAEMVELGADVCLAFIRDGSAGATHTADLAEKAGIPTRRWTA